MLLMVSAYFVKTIPVKYSFTSHGIRAKVSIHITILNFLVPGSFVGREGLMAEVPSGPFRSEQL